MWAVLGCNVVGVLLWQGGEHLPHPLSACVITDQVTCKTAIEGSLCLCCAWMRRHNIDIFLLVRFYLHLQKPIELHYYLVLVFACC